MRMARTNESPGIFSGAGALCLSRIAAPALTKTSLLRQEAVTKIHARPFSARPRELTHAGELSCAEAAVIPVDLTRGAGNEGTMVYEWLAYRIAGVEQQASAAFIRRNRDVGKWGRCKPADSGRPRSWPHRFERCPQARTRSRCTRTAGLALMNVHSHVPDRPSGLLM
jgi:hypothetical protein